MRFFGLGGPVSFVRDVIACFWFAVTSDERERYGLRSKR